MQDEWFRSVQITAHDAWLMSVQMNCAG